MTNRVSKYLNVKTPVEMWDLCHTIYHHSEYKTEYESVYRQKFDEIRYDYEDDIIIHTWEIEGNLIQKENITFIELGIDFQIRKNKNFDTTEVVKKLSDLLDDIVDYIILNTNIESICRT